MDLTIQELALAAKAAQKVRLEADRHAKVLKAEEDKAIAELQLAMTNGGLTHLSIPGVQVDIVEKIKPYLADYAMLEAYIVEHHALDLLQKRLTESAVKLRWEDGIQIPGVGVMTEQKLTIK